MQDNTDVIFKSKALDNLTLKQDFELHWDSSKLDLKHQFEWYCYCFKIDLFESMKGT